MELYGNGDGDGVVGWENHTFYTFYILMELYGNGDGVGVVGWEWSSRVTRNKLSRETFFGAAFSSGGDVQNSRNLYTKSLD